MVPALACVTSAGGGVFLFLTLAGRWAGSKRCALGAEAVVDGKCVAEADGLRDVEDVARADGGAVHEVGGIAGETALEEHEPVGAVAAVRSGRPVRGELALRALLEPAPTAPDSSRVVTSSTITEAVALDCLVKFWVTVALAPARSTQMDGTSSISGPPAKPARASSS